MVLDGAPVASIYQVRLPTFQGPIEILLALIEDQRLEITAISLAAVAGQFLEHITQFEQRSPAELADFIEVAARLLVIKSRALLPAATPADNEEDATKLLIERLQEYRRFRQVSCWLDERLQIGLASYCREPMLPEIQPSLQPLEPLLLLAAMQRLSKPALAETNAEGTLVVAATVHLGSKVKLILRKLLHQTVVFFADLISSARSSAEIVITFMAMLELLRRKRIQVAQNGLFAPIAIAKHTPTIAKAACSSQARD